MGALAPQKGHSKVWSFSPRIAAVARVIGHWASAGAPSQLRLDLMTFDDPALAEAHNARLLLLVG